MKIKRKITKTTKTKKSCLIKMHPSHLFQVPFTKTMKNYKRIAKVYTNDCLFNTLTALGLRHPNISYQDSMKMYKIKGDGVRVDYAGDYISSIFDTDIEMIQHHKRGLSYITSNLKNGYATFVCGGYDYKISKRLRIVGHFFIIYKERGRLYICDPSRAMKTDALEKSDLIKEDLIRVCAYYNINQIAAPLNKERMNNAIPF
jgi:hypothetical protein